MFKLHLADNQTLTYDDGVEIKPQYILPVREKLTELGVKGCDIYLDEGGVTFVFALKGLLKAVRVFLDEGDLKLTCSDDDADFAEAVKSLLIPLLIGALNSAVRKLKVADAWEKVSER